MEIGDVFGLPAHPLLVHVPVVLIPLVGLLGVAMVVRPAWRNSIGWLTVGLAAVAAIGAQLAVGAGEQLEERVRETARIEDHAQQGELARTLAVLLFVVIAAYVVVPWWTSRRAGRATGTSRTVAHPLAVALSVLVVVGAVASTAAVTAAGHSGAKSTWGEVSRAGDGDD